MNEKLIKSKDGSAPLAKRIKSFTSSLSSSVGVLGIKKKISGFGQNFNIAFLFDTTGSMYPYFELGRNSIKEIIAKVKNKVEKAKFCYIAYKNHGDEGKYFDGGKVFLATELTEDAVVLEAMMDRVGSSGGGLDGLTCLEDVFYHLNVNLRWDEMAVKAAVLIGDMPPHGVLDSVAKCPFEYNYQNELKLLAEKGIKIYSVFCFEEDELISERKQRVQRFFEQAAQITSGYYLELADIQDLVDLLVGICMKETNHLDDFILSLKNQGQLTTSKEKLLLRLKGGDPYG